MAEYDTYDQARVAGSRPAGRAPPSRARPLVGGEGDDDLYGNLRGDRLHGSEGSDRLAGGPDPSAEDDECHGGPGGDSLWRVPWDQRRDGCEVVRGIP
jgi:Ca2+-binding RTX toxin-like protein